MRPFGAWFGRLALAGGCLAWAGCGGGSVPDPDSDSNIAPEASARPVDRGAAQAPAAEAPAPEAVAQPEPGAAARPEPPAAVAANSPAPEAEKPAAVASAEPEKAAPAVKGDASGTEEMLRMAATPAPAASTSETPAAPGAPPGGPGGSEMAGGPGGRGPGREDSSGGPAIPPRAAQPPSGYPGSGGGSGGPAEAMGRENARPPGAGGPPGEAGGPMPPGGPGMRGGPGGSGGPGDFTGMGGPGGMNGTNPAVPVGPETFKHPATAAQAFLSALETKNKERLTQATARRAPTEADEKHRKIFAEIVEGSISEEELDEMSKAMNGFRVVSVLQAKSSGRIGVVITKTATRGDVLQRTITLRKEADGWKVLDISSMLDYKPAFRIRRR